MNVIDLRTTDRWRTWLAQDGTSATEVWLVIHHKGSVSESMRYHEAIEHALCFGWIDGLHRKHSASSSQLRFTPRSPRSTWSAINRERAQRMIESGLMTETGQATIDVAKAKGTWQPLTDDEIASCAAELRAALLLNPPACNHFHGFPPSSRRLIVEWIAQAKRRDTRNRRIERTVDLAAIDVRANH